jgi:hypothetical protein
MRDGGLNGGIIMTDSLHLKRLKPGEPASYLIKVQGQLEETWSARLAGMSITTGRGSDQDLVTTLKGRVRDQAELTGVLNSLYELHMPILSVQILNENDRPGEGH